MKVDEALIDEQYKAEAALTHLYPSIGGLASKLRIIYTDKVPTQATNGCDLLINPEWTSKLDFTSKVFVLAHEIFHCMLNHPRRLEGLNPAIANMAADYEVNLLIERMGLIKKSTMDKIKCLYNEKYEDLGVEAIYKKIYKKLPKMNGGSSGKDDNKFQNNPFGEVISKEDGDKIAKSEGEKPNPSSSEDLSKDWGNAAIEACRGLEESNLDDFILRIKDLYKISKDWKNEFKNIIGHSLNPIEFRRGFTNKNILITQERIARTDREKYDNMDSILAVVDTSGSVDQKMLNIFLKHIYHIANAKKPETITLIQFDTEICDIRTIHSEKDLLKPIKIKGGGGTDIKCVWDYINNQKLNTELCIVFTDGYLDLLKRNKFMNNLFWVIIDNPGCELEYRDANTRIIYLNSDDIKKG